MIEYAAVVVMDGQRRLRAMRCVPIALFAASLTPGCTAILGITDVPDVSDAGGVADVRDPGSAPDARGTTVGSPDAMLAAAAAAPDAGAPGHRGGGNDAATATCLRGADCTLRTSCQQMAIDCKTGVPLCTATGSHVTDGTPCGTDMVCGGGSCVACAIGTDCTPAMSCQKMVIDCATGTPLCKATGGDVTDGTPCGKDLYCNAGSCAACTNGAPCAPPGKPCNQGTVSCTLGQLVCTDQGTFAPDGTACGTNMVCKGGQCAACSANAACSSDNPCHVGLTSCTSGTSVCVDTGMSQTAGTPCTGADKCQQTYACQAGTCTGSNPVVCAAADVCHLPGTCDMATGACSTPAATDGTTCTGPDTCDTYGCTGGVCIGRLVGGLRCTPGCCINTDSCGRCVECSRPGTICNALLVQAGSAAPLPLQSPLYPLSP